MKINRILAVTLIALTFTLALCISSLQQTKRQLAATRAELETRKGIWGKLKNIADMYKGGVNMSLLEDPKKGSASMILRHSDWQAETRYEFASDGCAVRTFSEGKEVGWSFIPGRSLKQMQ